MPDQASLLPPADDSFNRLAALLGKQPLVAPGGPVRKPQDDVWDALVQIVGWQPEPRDQGAAKRFGKVVNELYSMGATPSDMKERASRYKQRWPGVTLGPESLVKHWSSLTPARRASDPHPFVPATHELDELLERDGVTMTMREWQQQMSAAGAAYLERANIDKGEVQNAVVSMMRRYGEMPL